MRSLGSVLLVASFFFAGCDLVDDPIGPETAGLTPNGLNFLIEDANHNDGNPHFFWLPPMVSESPTHAGIFDGSRDPTVAICEWSSTGCLAELATFTLTTGPDGETVEVFPADEFYRVMWHTARFELGAGKIYRIAVTVAGQQLGVADVQVVDTGRELSDVDREEYIGLIDDAGRTLQIKFRIEEGAVVPLPEILFRSERDGVTEIYGINADGNGLVRLTNGPELKQNPQWSPDGTRFLLTKAASTDGKHQSIFVVDAVAAVLDPAGAFHDDMSVSKSDCIPTRNNTCSDGQPSWAPGDRIIFSSNRDGVDLATQAHPELDLYLLEVATKAIVRRWVNPDAEESQPDISPTDPDEIVFASYRTPLGGEPFDLYLMNTDDEISEALNLTQSAGFADARNGLWSPDGTRIAFTGWTSSTREDVWIYELASGAFTSLNVRRHGFDDLAGGGSGIGWSPNSDQLVIAAREDGNWDCYIVDADGGDVIRRLTSNPANDTQCSWAR